MAAVSSGSGNEQLIEGRSRWSGDNHAAPDRVVPASHVEAKTAATRPHTMSFVVEAADLTPVVAAAASSVDVLPKSSRMIGDR